MAMETGEQQAFHKRITEAPFAAPGADAGLDALRAAAVQDGRQRLADILALPAPAGLIAGVLAGSPYLSALMKRDLQRLEGVLDAAPEVLFAARVSELSAALRETRALPDLMRELRRFKGEMALLIALCDLAGIWPVMEVTRRLSLVADAILQGGVRALFALATAKGDWLCSDRAEPDVGSGYIVLAMGKYGAYELNYSSDIDLIVFYERERVRVRDGLEPQQFMVRLTRDLVKILEERTGDGYVFRTDLRLRPDAGATQIALTTDSALNYYEAVGQNWERAALIKARACAGDIAAGEALLAELSPFVWRKYLDYAAIADVHAMKRQINAHRGLSGIAVRGHNLKLGPGGIREIEFFAQTQQLIAGGRQPDLRCRDTLDALHRLEQRKWITAKAVQELTAAYLFLRRAEHRLQMVADEQTHEVPSDEARFENVARFSGFPDGAAYTEAVLRHLRIVQAHYGALFEASPRLSADGVNMVFAGATDDPDTVAELARLGYSQPRQVLATVRAWHHGRMAVMRSARAREILTEVQPLLITAFSETASADEALASFDRFLSELPAGVQLFSLLKANPRLLRLVADIMGTAPRLARVLSRRRRLLDAVIDPRTFTTLPSTDELQSVIARELSGAADAQDLLDRVRVTGAEQMFLIGVRVLTGVIDAAAAGVAFARLAEELISALQADVESTLVRLHGRMAGAGAAVVAMGKLGGCEMTATSDLDLIVVYDFAAEAVQSEGTKPLAPTQYYARFTQRLIAALSAQTAEGALYQVDMRLRPSGHKGPVATQLSSFIHYQANEAWTWEHMALTRARVVTGSPELRSKVEAAIRQALGRPRNRTKIADDVRDMRERIFAEKGTSDIWDLKQVRGGLVDIEFIAQHLQLIHAAEHPEVLDQNTAASLRKLLSAGLLGERQAGVLIPAAGLLSDLTQILRLCLDGPFKPESAPAGLKELLTRAGGARSFAELEDKLCRTQEAVAALFLETVV